MTREEKVDLIINYFNDNFKWQKLVYDWEIDRAKVEKCQMKNLTILLTKIVSNQRVRR